jgi:inositol-phosphate phosphatase/L-galactose 1-phosphate phosphatase/histidinol-phosphatase
MTHAPYLPFMNHLADLAAPISQKFFRQHNLVIDKPDYTPVTEIDIQIETIIRQEIEKTYPNHGFWGEETGQSNIGSDYIWVIDPIDGTKAFITGKPLFGTLIGLLYQGKPVAGLIDQSFTRERWIGMDGMGSTHNGIPIQVAAPKQDLSSAKTYAGSPEMFDDVAGFNNLRRSVKYCLYGADCYAYGLLSMGHVDLVIEKGLSPHDFCALVPIIKNAGGYISGWLGEDLTLHANGNVVAASHQALAESAMACLLGGN